MTLTRHPPAPPSDASGGSISERCKPLMSLLVLQLLKILRGEAAGRGAAPLCALVVQKGFSRCA
jgi:hypothetical protein